MKHINQTVIIMNPIINKNYFYNLELRSLHYWFKNPSVKYDNVFKIIQNTTNKFDTRNIVNTNTQQFTNSTQGLDINFLNRVLLKSVMKHWKVYVIHKLHARRATYKADCFYQKKLQKMVLNALSKNVFLKWEHIVSSMDKCINKSVISLDFKKAEQHYSKFLLRKCFKYWCNYIAMKNRKKALLKKAAQFNNLYCSKKYIINWKTYVMLQRQKQDKIDEVHKFYAKRILEKFINAWRNICEFTLQKDKIEYAIMHHKNKVLVKYFSSWKMYHEYKITKLIVEKNVSAYYRKKLLRRYFEQFIVYANESIAEQIRNENTKMFYNSKLVQKVFLAWRMWYDKKLENATKICEIKRILENRRKHTTFINWRLYIIKKKCKRRKMFTAQNFYEKKLAIKVLRKFHNYVIYRKQKKIRLSYLNDKSEKIAQQLQMIYIEKWRNTLYNTMQEKQKLNQAVKFWELNLIHKYFLNWKEFSRQYKIKMIRKNQLNEIATDFLLKRFILHWYSKLQNVLEIRKKEIVAISKIENKITKKCFLSWKEYTVQKLKMNNDVGAAIELHRKLLLREALKEILRNSLQNIDYQCTIQLENATKRSFQNLEILKEYFDRWHSLIYHKMKSKPLCFVTNSNEFQLTETQMLYSNTIDSFETRLVLPEYMMEKSTILNNNFHNSIAKLA